MVMGVAGKRVENTAFGVGTLRALEGRVPAGIRLFDDPIAERLLTGVPALVVRNRPLRWAFTRLMRRAAPGFFGDVVCRTRAIDDACRDALAGGACQVVILGAGMDTRPYRMDELRSTRIWEVDLPAVQAAKKSAITRALGQLPAHVRYVPADLAAQRASDLLAANGFDPGARTLLVWEAVSQYLPGTAVEEILGYAGRLPGGSRLVFTYLPDDVIDGARHARRARRLAWQTGFDPRLLGRHLAAHGLTLLADLGAREYQERFLQPRGRVLDVFEIERVAVAQVGTGPDGTRSAEFFPGSGA
jgi:methyltransferase (TIGR00027 family)